jgi:hypothetical protein
LAFVLTKVVVFLRISFVQQNIFIYQQNKEMLMANLPLPCALRMELESGLIWRWQPVTTNWRSIKA